jgi:5-formyltetrahydrofolate cyclo-ligase
MSASTETTLIIVSSIVNTKNCNSLANALMRNAWRRSHNNPKKEKGRQQSNKQLLGKLEKLIEMQEVVVVTQTIKVHVEVMQATEIKVVLETQIELILMKIKQQAQTTHTNYYKKIDLITLYVFSSYYYI